MGISNQMITQTFQEQMQKVSMKDSVSKMIEEIKEIESFKIICAGLFKSMN